MSALVGVYLRTGEVGDWPRKSHNALIRADGTAGSPRSAKRMTRQSGEIRSDRAGEVPFALWTACNPAGIGDLTIDPVIADALRMRASVSRFYIRLRYRHRIEGVMSRFAPAARFGRDRLMRSAASAMLVHHNCLRSKAGGQHRRRGERVLKLIDPSLNVDVLHALRSMGHGDELVLCDANFPADSVARHTVLGRLLHIDNVSAARAAKAILSLLPLDHFGVEPALRMEIAGKPDKIPTLQVEVQSEIDRAEGRSWPMGSVERMAFYERARQAYCVIRSGERRFYGCFIFKKGVVSPDVVL